MSHHSLAVIALLVSSFSASLAHAGCEGVKPYAFYTTNLYTVLQPEPGESSDMPPEECGDPQYQTPVYDQAQIPEGCYKLPATVTITCKPASLKNTSIEVEAVIITQRGQDPESAELRIRNKLTIAGKDHFNSPYITTQQSGADALKVISYDSTAFQGTQLETVSGQKFTGFMHVVVDVDTVLP
jgi:hypothetical protein